MSQVNLVGALLSCLIRISCFSTPSQLWRAYIMALVALFMLPLYTECLMSSLFKELLDLATRQGSSNSSHEKGLVRRFGRLHLPRALWLTAASVYLAHSTITVHPRGTQTERH